MDYNAVDKRADAIARADSLEQALARGLPPLQPVSVSEALILGLLNQGVRKYIGILGHGNTDLANILSVYEARGLVRLYNVRHEVEAAHCASALRWQYGETAAVITSIGPGALHAFAGSLTSASNGIGVYHLYGDETTHDEGPNMQQLPGSEQAGFLKMAQTMGGAYQLHTPEAVFSALRKGAATVFNSRQPQPFFFLMPMNIQPYVMQQCNLAEIPEKPVFPPTIVQDETVFEKAAELILKAGSIVIKFGGGAVNCGAEIKELADLIDAVIVSGAKMNGVVPYNEPRFMSVGGSKGSISGNYAMENADLVVAVGARGVCQWDSSGTAWKKAQAVINFNTREEDAGHYNRSVIVLGDARLNLREWIAFLRRSDFSPPAKSSKWLRDNLEQKEAWQQFKQQRYDKPMLRDEVWQREVLTQPAAIKEAYDFATEHGAARYFDAGDVQANGFQVVEDEDWGLTFSDTGASYMGFAVSAVLATAIADEPVYTFAFSGDGSFTMNPQILIDGIQHGARGCIILFDNRRMAAITGLQEAQYQKDFRTSDHVGVNYVALASAVEGVQALSGGYSVDEFRAALSQAYEYDGLSFIHLPVYAGEDELGGLGAFGSWNVGNWCTAVQEEHHRLGL